MKAYLSLIQHALDAGFSIRVDDGEETFPPSTDYNEIKENTEAVEQAWLELVKNGKYQCQALVILPGPGAVSDEESVADYTYTEGDDDKMFIENWFDKFHDSLDDMAEELRLS